MKSLAIDFGEKRVGLAISDPAGRLAVPFSTLIRRSDTQLLKELTEVVTAESIERLVIGDPRRLDGSAGPASRRVTSFAAKLERATGLPCVLVEEALTSREAARRLRQAGLDPKRLQARLDEMAAQILLEEVLHSDTEVKET